MTAVISYPKLVERVGHYLFGVRTGFSSDQSSDIDDCIHDGLNRVYSAHDWSFLRPIVEIDTVAESDQVIMSTDFESVANDSELTYEPGADCWYPPVRWRHDSTIRKLQQSNDEMDRPVYYTVRSVEFDPAVGSRKAIVFYPTPDQVYTLRVPVVLRPVVIDQTNEYPIGGQMLSQVILEACLAAAEHNFEEREHIHEKRFMEMIALAIRDDQHRSSPTSLGPDAPRGENGRFRVFDYDYRLREQRIGGLTLGGDSL